MEDDRQLTLFKEEPKQIVSYKEQLAIATDDLVNATTILSNLLRENLAPPDLATLHDWTSKTAEDLDAFKDIARQRLNDLLTTQGRKVTEKGTLQLDLGGGRVQRAIPTNTRPDAKLTQSVLRGLGLSENEWMDKDIKYVVNELKLKELRDMGQLSEDDYKKCFKPQGYRIGKSEIIKGDDDE